jgi:DNA-binding PadR family transcriptional regulator
VVRTRTEQLLTGEWACLGILAPAPTHGFAIAGRLAPSGDIGRVWSLSRPLTYRALDQLATRGLIRTHGHEPGIAGGNRTILAITPTGRRTLRRWLHDPVAHLRDARAELLLKIVLCDLNGVDREPLLVAQRDVFTRLAGALAAASEPDDAGVLDPVDVWREEASRAAVRFLDRLLAETPAAAGRYRPRP